MEIFTTRKLLWENKFLLFRNVSCEILDKHDFFFPERPSLTDNQKILNLLSN